MDPEYEESERREVAEPSVASSLGSAGALAGLGLQFALSIVLFLYVGRWVDSKLGTAPLFLIVGVFVGAGASFYNIYRTVSRAETPSRAGKGGGKA